MAMLQLGGTLSNATVRVTPRASWWITAQHLLSASSLSTIPNPVEDSTKDEKVYKKPTMKQRTGTNQLQQVDGSLITAAFKSLLEPAQKSVKGKTKILANKHVSDINSRINSAENLDELLSMSEAAKFNQQNAYSIIYVLCNWISSGKIKMSEVQTDKRYMDICNMLGMKSNLAVLKNERTLGEQDLNTSLNELMRTEKTKKQIERFNVQEIISVLTALAAKQTRTIPLLKIIALEITFSKEKLNIKELGDILYSVATLNFYDEALMEKISKELMLAIPVNEKNAVIGSILTSCGVLRYRNEDLLNLLSTWIIQYKSTIRPQEICSLMKTLAYLGFTPKNFDEVIEHIISPLKESEMCQSSDWLDIVWALTVLNKANAEHYASVLNEGFLNRISDDPGSETTKAFNLLNINASARLFLKDYTGPLLPEDSKLFDVLILKSKEKLLLSNSVISALKIMLPSDSIYLNVNKNTRMGFLLDAEFFVDNNCTPLPVNVKTEINKPVFRIAVLTCSYHEFCRGTHAVLGTINLRKTLLQKEGYQVLLIPYTDVNNKDKLVDRVKYIVDNVKLLLENSVTQ